MEFKWGIAFTRDIHRIIDNALSSAKFDCCPFCGGKVKVFYTSRFSNHDCMHVYFNVKCNECGVVVSDSDIKVLENKWNSRYKGEC